MTVKVYTSSGQFSVNKKETDKEQPQYIQASGGNETIVSEYEKLSHPYCGTPKCCGQCSTADTLDEDFTKHCKAFFKGE